MIAAILTILTTLGVFVMLICWVLRKDTPTLIFLGITIGLFISTMLINMSQTKPTAMDVYQNKTTLEYTIRDGEIVDSVVVFKNK